jgi:hypothetical protein
MERAQAAAEREIRDRNFIVFVLKRRQGLAEKCRNVLVVLPQEKKRIKRMEDDLRADNSIEKQEIFPITYSIFGYY